MMEDGVVCACYPGYDDYNVYLDGDDDSDDHRGLHHQHHHQDDGR